VLKTLVDDGYDRARLFPVENKTVVTNPMKGCRNNKWEPVLRRHGVPFIPLPDVEWMVYRFASPLLKLNDIFPEGIEIPKMYVGKNVLHAPTCKVHGHSVTTGAIKNSFGGLLKEVRHYAHEFILASQDQVAIDAIAARIMGFDPLSIRYLAMCHERGLGVADPRDIEIVGDVDAAATRMGFTTSRSLVI